METGSKARIVARLSLHISLMDILAARGNLPARRSCERHGPRLLVSWPAVLLPCPSACMASSTGASIACRGRHLADFLMSPRTLWRCLRGTFASGCIRKTLRLAVSEVLSALTGAELKGEVWSAICMPKDEHHPMWQ